jgi:alpha-beta hydrolase superfamily lysophospholipase
MTSPLLGIYVKVPAVKRLLGKVMSVVYPRFSLPSGLNPEHVSHDPEMVRGYAEDPLVFEISTARWFTEAMRAIEEVKAEAGRLAAPCLMMQAGDDRIADPRCAKPVFEAMGARDKQYVEYAGFYHELVNEVERGRVLADMTEWLGERI